MFGRRFGDRAWQLGLWRVAVVAMAVLACGGCAGGPVSHSQGIDYDPTLISGERLFGRPLDPGLVDEVDLLAVDGGMRAYVLQAVGATRRSEPRLRALLEGLLADGYFATPSNIAPSLTAAEAFRTRHGNCLSYTNLFVALAREAGFEAVYQVVDVPPVWEADSGFLIRYTHINVLLPRVRIGPDAGLATVDFNVVDLDPAHPRRVVSDAYAASLYYANRSVDFLRDDRPQEAFSYLRHAIGLAPENADLWINLGAFYASRDDVRSAIEAYRLAERLAPTDRAVLSALARSYAKSGDPSLAAAYERKARDYLETNPFYHLARAQTAMQQEDYATGLAAIDRAVALDPRNGRFRVVKAQIEERLGNLEEARASYRSARRYGATSADGSPASKSP